MVPKLTTAGYNLMLGALDGTAIQFTRIKLGNGDVPEDYRLMTDLGNPILDIGLSGVTLENHYALLKAPVNNAALTEGFFINEIGVFAADPEGGEDILYAYGHWVLSNDDEPLWLPPVINNLVEITHQVYVYVGEAENITAIVAASANYASAAELKAHMDNNKNPHGVNATDVGLGNVPNVKPENQQPEFDETLVPLTKVGERYSFPNIASRETLGSILRKLRTAISLLINHVNAKNVHGVTAKGIGAAEATHYHNASDINKGTLPVGRGGTGAGNANEAKIRLDIQCGEAQVECQMGAQTYVEVAFPAAFTGRTPHVVLTPRAQADNLQLDYSVDGETKGGFRLWVYAHNFTGTVTFVWIAL